MTDPLAKLSPGDIVLGVEERKAIQRAAVMGYPLNAVDVRRYEATVAALEAERDALTAGPYSIRACRGHWHVEIGGSTIMTDAGDAMAEDIARAEAGRLNAAHKQDVESLRSTVAALEARHVTDTPSSIPQGDQK